MAIAHDRDAVAHLDRLVDVVGHEDHGLPELAVQAQEVVLETVARDRVDRAEGLVHQHDRRIDGHRARYADALLLAAGELAWVAAQIVWVEPHELEQLACAAADALLGPAQEPRHRADVVLDRHVREQSDLLEHVADPASQLGDLVVVHAAAVDRDVAAGHRDQAVHELERGRFAATGRSDQDADIAGGNLEGEVLYGRLRTPRILLGDAGEGDLPGFMALAAHGRVSHGAPAVASPGASVRALLNSPLQPNQAT